VYSIAANRRRILINYSALFSAIICGLAIYTMRWSFSFGSHKIYLPKESEKRWFFDTINEKHSNLFRILSSVLAAIGIAAYTHGFRIWIAIAAVFAIAFSIYFFTCIRSYLLVGRNFSKYYED
jgi:hypothetical protein